MKTTFLKVTALAWVMSTSFGLNAYAEYSSSSLSSSSSFFDTSSQDSDGDGVSDQEESYIGTNPQHPDTDGDQLAESFEIANGLDPLVESPFLPEFLRLGKMCGCDCSIASVDVRAWISGTPFLVPRSISCERVLRDASCAIRLDCLSDRDGHFCRALSEGRLEEEPSWEPEIGGIVPDVPPDPATAIGRFVAYGTTSCYDYDAE